MDAIILSFQGRGSRLFSLEIMLKQFLLFILICYLPHTGAAEYQSQEDFVQEAFAGNPPKPKSFWIKKELKQPVSEILQHSPGFLRARYWLQDDKSVWILNETGKTQPITVGIIIEKGKISLLKVLTFRESRGWEVKHEFFTDQFKQASLLDDYVLDKPIDGISGATLSVRALTKTAKLALFFDQQIRQ